MSFKAEVIADSSGKFVGNALRFATKAEAVHYAIDLHSRWTAVSQWRVLEVDEPATDRWENGRAMPLPVVPELP